jgi:outer membrane biosynthesis protein TonB
MTSPRGLTTALLLVALGAGACAKPRPQTVPDGPALAMPLPPPRVFQPAEEPPAEEPPAPPEVAAVETPKPAPPRPARRPAPPAEAARPEPEPPAPVAAAPAPEPARELRAAPSAADATAERQVTQLLQRAARDLNRVDYRRLSAEGKSQYEQAQRFSTQAYEALKERNFVFAATLADKAATLASQLAG